MKKQTTQKIALTGLMAALSYVVFTFLQIKIPLPGGDATSIHLGNAVCVLGALLLGGVYGGLGGAIGMTIGDLLDPVYIVYAPKTEETNKIMNDFAKKTGLKMDTDIIGECMIFHTYLNNSNTIRIL